jgi:hypothetical protein
LPGTQLAPQFCCEAHRVNLPGLNRSRAGQYRLYWLGHGSRPSSLSGILTSRACHWTVLIPIIPDWPGQDSYASLVLWGGEAKFGPPFSQFVSSGPFANERNWCRQMSTTYLAVSNYLGFRLQSPRTADNENSCQKISHGDQIRRVVLSETQARRRWLWITQHKQRPLRMQRPSAKLVILHAVVGDDGSLPMRV